MIQSCSYDEFDKPFTMSTVSKSTEAYSTCDMSVLPNAFHIQTQQVASQLIPKKNQHKKPSVYRVTNFVHRSAIPVTTIAICKLTTIKERIPWRVPKKMTQHRGQYSLQNCVRKEVGITCILHFDVSITMIKEFGFFDMRGKDKNEENFYSDEDARG